MEMSGSLQGIHCTPLSAPVFLFGAYSMRRSRWPSGRRHDQKSQKFCFQEYSSTPSSLYEAWSHPLFQLSCFISRRWSGSEPSQLSAVMCWTLKKLHLSTLGRSGGEIDLEINLLSEESLAGAISPLLKRYNFLCPSISTSPTLRKKKENVLTRIPDAFSEL